MNHPATPAAAQPATAPAPSVLARVAEHELLGPLRVQRRLLHTLRERHRRVPGPPVWPVAGGHPQADPADDVGPDLDGDLDLAIACADDVLGVLDLVVALASGRRDPEPCPVDEVLVRACRPWALVPHVTRPAARTTVDGRRLLAVVRNLVANASQHALEPGPVRVRATLLRGRVQVRVHQPGRLPDVVPHALARREPPAGPRGLGLWLVHRLVDDMFGSVVARQDPDRTTWSVRVQVPACQLPGDEQGGQDERGGHRAPSRLHGDGRHGQHVRGEQDAVQRPCA
ncbi:ATP-binding protein [Thalassiella azotivora]